MSYQQPPRRVSKLRTRKAAEKERKQKRQKYKREIAVRREDSVKLEGGAEGKERKSPTGKQWPKSRPWKGQINRENRKIAASREKGVSSV